VLNYAEARADNAADRVRIVHHSREFVGRANSSLVRPLLVHLAWVSASSTVRGSHYAARISSYRLSPSQHEASRGKMSPFLIFVLRLAVITLVVRVKAC